MQIYRFRFYTVPHKKGSSLTVNNFFLCMKQVKSNATILKIMNKIFLNFSKNSFFDLNLIFYYRKTNKTFFNIT